MNAPHKYIGTFSGKCQKYMYLSATYKLLRLLLFVSPRKCKLHMHFILSFEYRAFKYLKLASTAETCSRH